SDRGDQTALSRLIIDQHDKARILLGHKRQSILKCPGKTVPGRNGSLAYAQQVKTGLRLLPFCSLARGRFPRLAIEWA
ncbi:MAG: hypothetical protein AAGK02_13490, partial [Pseudomonadota bacterium]